MIDCLDERLAYIFVGRRLICGVNPERIKAKGLDRAEIIREGGLHRQRNAGQAGINLIVLQHYRRRFGIGLEAELNAIQVGTFIHPPIGVGNERCFLQIRAVAFQHVGTGDRRIVFR